MLRGELVSKHLETYSKTCWKPPSTAFLKFRLTARRWNVTVDCLFSYMEFFFLPQIEGAFIQGVGLYTIEELNYSPQGVLYTRGPNQYKIPAICDVPTELHVSLLPPSQNSNTLYSSKVSCALWINACLHDICARREGLHSSLGCLGVLPGL